VRATPQQVDEYAEEEQGHGHGGTPAHVVDGAVRTLGAAAHLANV